MARLECYHSLHWLEFRLLEDAQVELRATGLDSLKYVGDLDAIHDCSGSRRGLDAARQLEGEIRVARAPAGSEAAVNVNFAREAHFT